MAEKSGCGLLIGGGQDGQNDAECGAVTCFANVSREFDASAVLFNDSFAYPESQSGARVSLCGEEWFEEVL
jgi:hypothetical protein